MMQQPTNRGKVSANPPLRPSYLNPYPPYPPPTNEAEIAHQDLQNAADYARVRSIFFGGSKRKL